ncbi:DUF427 domain-containing protein [Stappia sp. F7233]|uniref:DUF427 domain-containing protein n=1 Tax=Stappia albiluteola TaxID=2758565 RepID=A0A839AJL4_9HYPH|nr:DUF427 domain-containing protein [Stappia albiluteola]MBA5779266.1 DUF427 domain-containing protein [Stappia albiluteola]
MSGNSGPGYASRPDHKITLSKPSQKLRVRFAGKVIAETGRAIRLQEASYPPVHYVPIADVSAEALEKTAHSTYCPFKGEASYWSLVADGKRVENAVWGYETPYDEVLPIKDHVAFYPDRVEAIEAF